MQHSVKQIVRTLAAVSMGALVAAPAGAFAQSSPMQGAASSSMAAPTRTPEGARGEDPHYPSKESLSKPGDKSKHPGAKPAPPASGGETGN